MVETWQADPGGRQSETELIEVETPAEPKSRRDQATLMDLEAEAEQQQ